MTATKKKSKKAAVHSVLVPDWQVKAAAQASGPSPAEVSEDSDKAALEQSFLDQAYQRVANNIEPMMQSPYRVGFEVISRNTDNTRLAGVFIFRVRKEMFMAPVFFTNGTITGTDLLYRHTAKKFVPATEEWASYLVGNAGVGEGDGQGVPMSMRQQAHDQLHLERLAYPPNSYTGMASGKWASTKKSQAIMAEALPDLTRAIGEQIKQASTSSVLKQFIQEDGGWNAVKKIANTAKANFKFANALFCASDESHYMPDIDYIPKSASAPADEPVLTLHIDLLNNPQVKSASVEDLAKGYSLEDKRPEDAKNDVLYTDAEKDLQSVGEAGIYNVLLSDGATHEMLCAGTMATDFCDECYPTCCDSVSSRSEPGPELSLVDLSDKQSLTSRKGVLGNFVKSVPEDIGDASPKSGKAYRLYCADDKSLSRPFYVDKVSKDNLGLARVYVRNQRNECKTPLVLNPDFDKCDMQDKVIGKCCRFIEVASEKKDCEYAADGKEIIFKEQINLGSKYAMDQFIYENGYKKASVRKSGDNYLFKSASSDRYIGEMSKLGCKCYLMGACSLTEGAAEKVLQEVDKAREFDFMWQEKKAYNLRFTDFPVFPESMNEEYGVNEQPSSSRFVVNAQRDTPVLPKQRIGDRYSQETQDTIDQMQPMELYMMSKEKGMPNLFEHGMVGSLVNTYDSSALIEKYLPVLEDGLDRIGRILFLFYWKPEDFVKAFGSDDQDQLENKLVSNFKSFGALILELTQKNQQRQAGSGSVGLS